MSIFRNTLTPTIREQLTIRQTALKERTPASIMYANARNSWVRMTSGVNVDGKDIKAKQYVLLGGVLLNKKLRAGVGGVDKAYSSFAPSLSPYNDANRTAGTAGIKPMPGITSVDIKSKTAYGSLREVVVNFSCNNIQQLEDLELLYMRPGYTVLIEWGYTPYLVDKNKLESSIDFCDHVLNGTKERDEIFLDLFKRSIKHKGNYDALYGYVKNYNWTARMDGGYNCQTTIISIGEIMESLKVGYIPFDIEGAAKNGGLLGDKLEINNLPSIIEETKIFYSKNILAGLCKSLYNICVGNFRNFDGDVVTFTPSKSFAGITYNMFVFSYIQSNPPTDGLQKGNIQAYITLEGFIDMLNTYVLMHAGKDENSSSPFISVSTKPRTYEYEDNPDNKNPNPNESSLLCLAHPLQVSVDPTVCLITNPLWAGGIDTSGVNDGANNGAPSLSEYKEAIKEIYYAVDNKQSYSVLNRVKLAIKYTSTGEDLENNAKEFVRAFLEYIKETRRETSIYEIENLLNYSATTIDERNVEAAIKEFKSVSLNIYNVLVSRDTVNKIQKEDEDKKALTARLEKGENPNAVKYLKNLAQGNKFFENNDTETGNIANIYVNIDFLYRLSVDSGLQTKNQELKVHDYLKALLKEVQESIGGVNTFEIHVDPQDNIARVVDVNYIDLISKKSAYEAAFQIEAHNTSGTVRSYSLQSMIFPEQGALVAIGAQVKGGTVQGTQNALLDFNNNLEDRVIKKKVDPPASNPNQTTNEVAKEKELATQKLKRLGNSLTILRRFFGLDVNPNVELIEGENNITYNQSFISEYKMALKDIISYFQSVSYSNTKGRAIIPVKMSLTMDGIGGLVIGHLFKVPSSLLPKGYKSDNLGGKLIQTITAISHKIDNNDWTTTIDAQNIVTSESASDKISFKSYLSTDPWGNVILNPTADSTRGFNKTDIDTATEFFINLGYSKEAAAAMVGSFLQESGLNPKAITFNSSLSFTDRLQTYAAGIAQWVGDRRINFLKFAKTNGINIPRYNEAVIIKQGTKTASSYDILKEAFSNMTLEIQLKYAAQEAALISGFSSFKNETDLDKAVKWVYEKYEGGDYTAGAALGSRGSYAKDILDKLKAPKYIKSSDNSSYTSQYTPGYGNPIANTGQ
jgi:hypothetical protein